MAEITYDSILSSKPYCFLVGPREREFFIHASLAANKSPVLDYVVNGRMKEEANGCAVWRHVDEDTFVRFGQYIYTGDYEGRAPSHPVPEAPPEPLAEEKEPQPEPENVAEEAIATSPVREPARAVELDAVVERVPDDQVVPEKDVWGFFTSRAKVGGDYDWGFGAAREKPADEEKWDVPAEPEPEPEPEPVREADSWGLPTKKKSKKQKKTFMAALEPELVEAVVELPMYEEPAPAEPADEEKWDAPAEPEPEPETFPETKPVCEADPCGLPTKKKSKKQKKKIMAALGPEPVNAVVELPMDEEPTPAEPVVDFWTGRLAAASPGQAEGPESPPPPSPKRSAAWHNFATDLRYEPGSTGPFHAPENDKDMALEFAGVFLSHARVHALADEYRVKPLAQLALHKLHRILCAFTLHEARIGDVVALLRYSYGEPGEALRVLASAFAACHLKTLWTSAAFRELFAGCGELALAIVGHIIERLD